MSIENIQVGASQASMLAKMEAGRLVASGVSLNQQGVHSLSFGDAMRDTFDRVNAQQVSADEKIRAYELGHSDDLIGATVASQKASLSFSALMQVRNKLVSGFDELIKMPL